MECFLADVKTEHAGSYLKQLCRHWGHKFPVEFTDKHGKIELPTATCVLDASAAALAVGLTVQDGGDAERMKQVVAEHLQRFGFRETLVFDWRAA